MNIKKIQDVNKPAVLVFSLSEFFQSFGISVPDLPQNVYDSPFYIYDTSLDDVGPEFEDEEEISEEDCDAGFSIIRTIWEEYIIRAKTPGFKYIFKIIKDPETNSNSAGSIYGFAPGYDMNSAIENITRQGFITFSWDEFWDKNLILTTESVDEIYTETTDDSEYVQLLLKIDTESYMGRTSFGGLPVKDRNTPFEWPKCDCGTELQYQFKIRTSLGLEMVFMPNCGHNNSNKVVIIDADNLEFAYPEEKEVALRENYAASITNVKTKGSKLAKGYYPTYRHNVLGQISTDSLNVPGDNYPKCDGCDNKMHLAARFDGSSNRETSMTFGEGSSYLFDCLECKTAKFITQN
ncbi:hypothetical protein [Chryseobacterium sp. JK1]|uniref:hypothetical protein n=1 Tax=Chryseobacterium sp. JK1 TaxID=874294 RepID=UPI003D685E35